VGRWPAWASRCGGVTLRFCPEAGWECPGVGVSSWDAVQMLGVTKDVQVWGVTLGCCPDVGWPRGCPGVWCHPKMLPISGVPP